jgi:lipoate-protein ligase B
MSSTGRTDALLLQLGRVDYPEALGVQRRVHALRAADEIPDTLILVEHPPVITLGRNAGRENLLVSDDELARRGVELHKSERGGDITFHGPGQLVGYPVFRLESGLVGVRRFVELVEESLIGGLERLGVRGERRKGYIGVWTGGSKVASIGVAVSRRVTFHGFALNVSTDLSWFELMNPCGIDGVRMTSVERESGEASLSAARDAVVQGFEASFGCSFQRNLPRSLTSATKGASS